jgi:hypothetical protein
VYKAPPNKAAIPTQFGHFIVEAYYQLLFPNVFTILNMSFKLTPFYYFLTAYGFSGYVLLF